jgi:hypothetical protein
MSGVKVQESSASDELRRQARAARRLGDLSSAARHYERLLELAPSDLEARWGLLLFGEAVGGSLDENAGPGQLAPFARFSPLLGPEDRRRIEVYLHSHLPDLVPATIFRDGARQRASETRSAQVLLDPGDVPGWFLARVRERLPRASALLGEPAFHPERTELHLSLSLDGDFYAPHTDDTTGYAFRLPRIDSRRISFVYYSFRSPARFTGGELRLYDRCDAPDRFDAELYTSLVPQDDMLVFFPSSRFHGVAPVSLQSDDPRDGRFTINGWLHAAP